MSIVIPGDLISYFLSAITKVLRENEKEPANESTHEQTHQGWHILD